MASILSESSPPLISRNVSLSATGTSAFSAQISASASSPTSPVSFIEVSGSTTTVESSSINSTLMASFLVGASACQVSVSATDVSEYGSVNVSSLKHDIYYTADRCFCQTKTPVSGVVEFM